MAIESLQKFIEQNKVRVKKETDSFRSLLSIGDRKYQRYKISLDGISEILISDYFSQHGGMELFFSDYRAEFMVMHQWEKKYTDELAAKHHPETRVFYERKIIFKELTSIFKRMIDVASSFEQDDGTFGVYHKFKSTRVPDNIKDFLTLLSSTIAEIVSTEINEGIISLALLKFIGFDDRLQQYQPKKWMAIYDMLGKIPPLKSTPLLQKIPRAIMAKSPREIKRKRKAVIAGEEEQDLNDFLQSKINRKLLLKSDPGFKTDENKRLQETIKELLSELREGDEILIHDAVEVIKEYFTMELTKSEELIPLLKHLIEEMPDFNYIRLKSVFRRTDTSLDDMISNLDRKFIEWENTRKNV